MKTVSVAQFARSILPVDMRANVITVVILSLLLGMLGPFLAAPAYAQAPDEAARRKKWLNDSIALIEKLHEQRHEQLALDSIAGTGAYVGGEIGASGSLTADTVPYYTLANKFDTYFKAPESAPPPEDDPIKDQSFYHHPINYFKHHINWVTNKDYDKKINWAALVADFDTWKAYEKEIWDRYVEIKTIAAEIAQLREAQPSDPDERARIEAKIAELQKKQEGLQNKNGELLKFRGRYGFVLDTEPHGIAKTIVLTDQLAKDNGLDRFPYPYGKRVAVDTSGEPVAQPVDDRSQGGGERMLFVIGRGLPTNYSEPITVTSEDPSISYTVIALERAPQDSGRKDLFAEGRKMASVGLDPATKTLLNELDAVLLRATVKTGVTAGLKDFTINNFEGTWELRFGDDIAHISFARSVQSETSDPAKVIFDRVEITPYLFLPEQIWIEVRTLAVFPVDEIKLRMQVQEKEVRWNATGISASADNMPGTETITAKLVGYEPAGNIVEVRERPEGPGRLARRMMAVYRTPAIEIYKAGETVPGKEPGVFRLPVEFQDYLCAMADDPALFRWINAEAIAYNDPSEVGMSWRHALTKAAKLNNYDVADWNRLEGKPAAEIANYVVTNTFLPNREGLTVLQFYRLMVPGPFQSIKRAPKFHYNPVRERVAVTLADHAALLLFKDAFAKMLEHTAARFGKVIDADSRWEAAAWYAAIKVAGNDGGESWTYVNESGQSFKSLSSPWKYIRVPGPKGGEVPFSFALSDDYLDKTFGKTDDGRSRARIWTVDASKSAIAQWKEAMQFSLTKIKETPDKDIAALLELIGPGYEAVLPHINPRLMKLRDVGSNGYQRWHGDFNPRMALARLQTPAEAVRAQSELSRLDTRFLIAMATAIAAPIVMGFTTAGSMAALLIEELIFNAGMSLLEHALFEIPDAIRQRSEIRFAFGASMIIGSERLRIAEVSKTEWYEIGLQILITYIQGRLPAEWLKAFAGVAAAAASKAVSPVKRAVSSIRTGLVLRKVRRGGLAAFEKLSVEDTVSLLDFITEANAVKKKSPRRMTWLHRRAAEVGDQLVTETLAKGKANAPTVKPVRKPPVVEAKADPGPPRSEPEPEPEPAQTEDYEPTSKNIRPREPVYTGDAPITKRATPAPSATPPRKFPNAPPPGKTWRTAVNQKGETVTFNLGKLLGEGGYAAVYELLDANGRPTGNVIKIFQRQYYTDDGLGFILDKGPDVVNNIRRGAEALREAGIPQLPNSEYSTNGEFPYIIQELRRDDKVVFNYKNTVRIPDPDNPGQFTFSRPLDPNTLAAFQADEGLQRAVVELFWKLAKSGLIWEDCHLGNLYFTKDQAGKWAAGILDQDRLIPFTERRGEMGLHIGVTETNPIKINSLANSPKMSTYDKRYLLAEVWKEHGIFFASAEFFMEKMFEHKDWLFYNVRTRRYEQRFLDPKIVIEKFPRLYSGAYNPPDLRIPNWRSR